MLLLDAYGGTIDDEGEGEAEARLAIDGYLGGLLPVGRANLLQHSQVRTRQGMWFVGTQRRRRQRCRGG